MEEVIRKLLDRGNELLNQPYRKIEFTRVAEADDLLNNLDDYPHAFVLACIMDRQIKAEKAWLIPHKFRLLIGSFEFGMLKQLSRQEIRDYFRNNKLHRFIEEMADNFYYAIQDIHQKYNGFAANMWANSPRSATIVRRFLQFRGVGTKIATMAANILARDFKIPMADKYCIDISPDVQVKRVFNRLGLISQNPTSEELIYSGRELNPEYPGIFDFSVWEIGRKWCRPKNPKCNDCYLFQYCPKIMI
jgi:endonuclease III